MAVQVTQYVGGKRMNIEKEKGLSGAIQPTDLWAAFEGGCSVRLLCPHAHSQKVRPTVPCGVIVYTMPS